MRRRTRQGSGAARLRGAVALAVALASLGGCRGGLPATGPVGPSPVPMPMPIVDPPRRPGHPLILIAMPDSPPFRVVRRSLVEELQIDFDVVTSLVGSHTSADGFARGIEQHRPNAVVVMDNPVLASYRRYADSRPPGQPAPPVVAVMTSFLEELRQPANTTGIAYEVPGVTAFVQLRSVIARPVHRVAVLYRPRFRGFIDRQVRLAAREQITLLPLPVSDAPTVAQIRATLRQARDGLPIDALWVLNDNGLLRDARFLDEAWRPELPGLGVPVVVGLSSLAAPDARFGTFAVVPDHEALGVQSAQLVFNLSQAGWRTDRYPIEPPISTVTIANLKLLQRPFGLRPGAAERIDRVVE